MTKSRPRGATLRTPLIALAVAASLGLTACWNGAFQTNVNRSKGGTPRFELVIEPKRSDVDASHFLVDSTTGDVWLLEVSSAKAGRWVRLADGPADAAELGNDRATNKKNRKKNKKRNEVALPENAS